MAYMLSTFQNKSRVRVMFGGYLLGGNVHVQIHIQKNDQVAKYMGHVNRTDIKHGRESLPILL